MRIDRGHGKLFRMARVVFPGGVAIRTGSAGEQATLPRPDWGVYADACWEGWPGVLVDWPDFGVPSDDSETIKAILEAVARARSGQDVMVACQFGMGRTGTMLAAVAVIAGVPPGRACDWVRARYESGAVETDSQRRWVKRRFGNDPRVRREAEKSRHRWVKQRTRQLQTAMEDALHAGDPLPRLAWAIPEMLAITQRPLRAHPEYGGSGWDYPREARAAIDSWIADLRRQGFRSIIVLTSNGELRHYDAATGEEGGLLALYTAQGLGVRHIPFDDPAHDPRAKATFETAVDELSIRAAQDLKELPHPAAMHCSAAIDRSPPVAARVAWLAETDSL